jgi:hypothetical protein
MEVKIIYFQDEALHQLVETIADSLQKAYNINLKI